MRILLIILMVVGILLLALLAFLTVCLFYPVSYRIKGEAEEALALSGRFWWLFGLLWFEFAVRDLKPEARFRIFGFRIRLGGEGTKEKKPRKAKASRTQPDAGMDVPREDGQLPFDETPKLPAPAKEQRTKKGSAAQNKRRPKKRIHAKARAKPKRAGRFGTFQEGYVKLREEYSDERNHMAVRHLWQEATYIFVHFMPKYAKGEVSYATGDPALTGQLTGVLSLLPVMYRYSVCICPDFASEHAYIRGTVVFGGKMSLYHAVLCLIRIIRDENAMRLIQKFR